MTLQEGGHITKDGWILVFMATTTLLTAAGIWLGIWTFYAPVSQSAFLEYKHGVEVAETARDARETRMENKIDGLDSYLRGIPIPAHGR